MLYRRFRQKLIATAAGTSTIGRKKVKMVFCIILIIAFFLVVFSITIRIRPLVAQLAEATTTDIITLTVNQAITEKMQQGNLDYNQLITLEKDENGNVTALVTNMAKMNMLQAEITNVIIEKLSEKEVTNIKIPIGNLIGGTLFSAHGPYIPVKIISLNNVDTKFSNEFSSAGINQTRHHIMLHVDVGLDLLLPGGTESTSVSVAMNVAETVIVGSVPNTYLNYDGQ